ncbi:hypothetical protein SAMN05216251_10593 [Actinacidiphila alni]|uniref:DUF11 domain-containing protein n=1 Tax=Actinacidiphila alni TaxID=380248 RepID=A0A1I2D5S9_9ACTN|nr:hypothetical protein [Actinacidiphila alni]SFE75886.1 hypothetical protein SAMN05216251_10593 [Actinacidiphila alni]
MPTVKALGIWRRSTAAPAVGAAVLFGLAVFAGPVRAADEPVLPLIALSTVGLPQPTDPFHLPQIDWRVDSDDDNTAVTNIDVTLDMSGISSFADVTPSTVCTGYTCEWKQPVLHFGAGGLAELAAKPGAEVGDSGTAVLSGTADGATLTPTTVKVTVGKVALVVNQLPKTEHSTPGDTLDAGITVSNTGQLPAAGADLELTTTLGLGFTRHFSNCVYRTKAVDKAFPSLADDALCHFAATLAPGTKYRLSAPLGLDVNNRALWDLVRYRVTVATGDAPTAAGHGPVLSLVPDGPALASDAVTADWKISTDNTADLVAGGDSARASVGDTVVVIASMRNEGPATVDVDALGTDGQLGVMVDIPKGTTAVKVPGNCGVWAGDGPAGSKPGAPRYVCEVDAPFKAGQVVRLPFTLRIDAGAPAVTEGLVRTTTVYGDEDLPFDPRHADDTAPLTVRVRGGATGSPSPDPSATGGTGSAGGTGGSARPDGQHGAAIPAVASSSTGGSGNDSGSLASTGNSGARPVAWSAATALAIGGAFFALARVRRTPAVDT